MKRLILVDVCNILHRLPEYRERLGEGVDVLAMQLMTDLRPLHDLEHWELHLVVDGAGQRIDQQFQEDLKTLSILFSPAHLSADSIIEKWLLRLGKDWSVSVASEDRAVCYAALANDAEILSAADLIQWVQRSLSRFRNKQPPQADSSHKPFGNLLDGL
jgi:predicted RNA-binding protein with PIN domain